MRIAVIGAGKIGSAVAKAFLDAGYQVTATRRKVEKLELLRRLGAEVTDDNRYACERADIIIVCVKPVDVEGVLNEVREEIKGKIVISMAASIKLSYLKKMVPEAYFVRVMPNLTVLVRESLVAYCFEPGFQKQLRDGIKRLLRTLGKPVEIEESKMDAITALSGCAPAYLSIIVEALTFAGLKVGLPKDIALLSAAQAMIGTGKLITEEEMSPLEIRDAVATPGGVTIEGLFQLEKLPLRYAFMKAVKAAEEKSKLISERFG
ncbi:pyrroline-5-carboxylate reductase [Candidatus Bathyarchaeota archaeon]|nr:MAG: pyrroline-5-carboxylate reductase [Candidatus Bathyarchaeota archaeon]